MKQDEFAKGMVESGEEHFGSTPELGPVPISNTVRPHLGRKHPGSWRRIRPCIARLLLQDKSLSFERYVISEPSLPIFSGCFNRVLNAPARDHTGAGRNLRIGGAISRRL